MGESLNTFKAVVTTLCYIVIMITGTRAFAVDLITCGILSQANTTYVLQNDVTSPGSCFFITASGITLDLNGHSVTYDNATPIAVTNGSFESDLSGSWDVTGAANASRVIGTFVNPVTLYDGSYSLKVTTPTADQAVVSVGTVTLAANTRYSLSAMVYNKISDIIAVSVEFNGTIKATQTGMTNRGFQYITKEFVTGATDETYNITLRVTGAGAVASGAVYFDDIKVQRNRLAGVMIGPVNWRNPPVVSDATQYGTALNAIIKNGSIVQGAGKSDWSPAIANEANSTSGHEISGLAITTTGANSKAIGLHSLISGNIHHNTLSASMSTITSRDNLHGTVLQADGYNTKIYNNIITNGVQGGIASSSTSGQTPNDIYNNDITLQGRYTNNFALSGNASLIHNNIVHCGSGNNSCRGIYGGGQGTSGTKVYDNTVEVQDIPRNQEYDGCQGYGTYGIQTENTSNSQVYGNTVTAYAGECEAHAYRANPEEGSATASNNVVHDNTFIAIASGTARAAALKLSGCKNSEISINNNTFKTNRRWIYASFDKLIDSLTLIGNRWETTGTLDSPFYPFENYNWQGSYVKDMVFVDNIYGSVADKASFESEFFRLSGSLNTAEPNSSFSNMWSIIVSMKNQTGQPVSDTSIVITDVNMTQVFNGTTDALGKVVISLPDFKNVAGTKTYYNPFTITATRINQTFTQTVTMDSPRSVSFTFDTTPPQINATPAGGTFGTPQSVTLSSNEPATIYYTLDGTEPTSASTVYSGAITIPSNKTLKFFGRDSAGNDSAVQSINYVIDQVPPVVTASPNGGAFKSQANVTLSANEPATIYYTTDGTEPTVSSTVYTQAIPINTNAKLMFIGKDAVGNISAVQTAIFEIDLTPPTITLTPVISPTILTSQKLIGTVTDNLPGTSVTVKVGSAAPVNATVTDTNWAFTVDNLVVGDNTITVTATDAADNTVTALPATIARVYAGAINTDGTITIYDAIQSLKYVLRLETPTPEQIVRSDVAPLDMTTNPRQPKPDGRLDIDDVLIMLRRAVGLSW